MTQETGRRLLASHWSETSIARILTPIQEFMHMSAAGGIVLMAATILALGLANSPLADEYDALLHAHIAISAGPFQLDKSVLHWINDGLMVIFFFLVGLEIKREVRVGELSNIHAALLPLIAAIGGVTVPALLYTAFNRNGPGAAGWGIPMATDIAFALGLLAILGNRIPFGLKVFLTAVAIVDDLIAVLVIAFFYSSGISWAALGLGFAILAVLLLGNVFGIRATLFYTGLGVIVWLAFIQSGIHATIAGVLVAFTVPARMRIDPAAFLERSGGILQRFQQSSLEPAIMLTDEAQQSAVIELEEACEDVQAPLQKLEHALHTWVQFGIIPIFALANAGVALSFSSLGSETTQIVVGILAGLVLGKPIGILGSSWIAVRMGLTVLPQGVRWSHMAGVGFVAGIGFTMSLFIASLAFGETELLETAKLGVLTASIVAGIIGAMLLRRGRPADE
jgi:NhaA family Na+:H+ antiporter